MKSAIATSSRKRSVEQVGKTLDPFNPHGTTQSILHLLRDGAHSVGYVMAASGASSAAILALAKRQLIIRSREDGENKVRLSRVGEVYLKAVAAGCSHQSLADFVARRRKPEVEVALVPAPYLDGGRLVLTPQCAYHPGCRGEAATSGIVVTFHNYGDHLEHRGYCCELHAAFDLLRIACDSCPQLKVVDKEGKEAEAEETASLVRRSLNGEPMLAEPITEKDIDQGVDDILRQNPDGPGA
jgi:hypothetical protein